MQREFCHDIVFQHLRIPSEIWTVTYYAVYGVTVETDFPFTWPVPRSSAPADLRFELTDTAPVEVDWDGAPAIHRVSGPPVVETGEQNESAVTYHGLDGLDVIRIRDTADHYVFSDRVVCHLYRPEWSFLAEIQFLGIVLALWLERQGTATLHASAAVVGDEAVAFLGAKGGGKTTAVTALVAAGHPLLVDDLLAVGLEGERLMARPGYPMLRLEPDQVQHFVGGRQSLPIVHPDFTKRRVRVGEGFGAFYGESAPLRRVYVPVRQRDPEAPVAIEPLRPRDAVLAMLQHSYLRDALHPMGLDERRFETLAQALKGVRFAALRYPNGFEHLPSLVQAVERDLARE